MKTTHKVYKGMDRYWENEIFILDVHGEIVWFYQKSKHPEHTRFQYQYESSVQNIGIY